MTNDTQFKKEVRVRKKDYEEKKIELISRLCAEEPVKSKEHKEIKK